MNFLQLSDEEWSKLDLEVSHGLTRPDAVQLAQKYGQIIGLVVQDQNTGEAIGCVTISVKANNWPELQVTRRQFFRRELVALAEYTSLALVK